MNNKIHCVFYKYDREMLAFTTTSKLLLEKFLAEYNLNYLRYKYTVKHLTKEELVEYHNRDSKVQISWDVDEVLASVYGDICCNTYINLSAKTTPFVRYELSNSIKQIYTTVQNYTIGSHSNTEKFIQDLEEKIYAYTKMGLDKETFLNISNLEIKELAKKYDLALI